MYCMPTQVEVVGVEGELQRIALNALKTRPSFAYTLQVTGLHVTEYHVHSAPTGLHILERQSEPHVWQVGALTVMFHAASFLRVPSHHSERTHVHVSRAQLHTPFAGGETRRGSCVQHRMVQRVCA